MTEMTLTPSDDVMILQILTSRSFKRVLNYILSDQTPGTILLVLLRSVLTVVIKKNVYIKIVTFIELTVYWNFKLTSQNKLVLFLFCTYARIQQL